MAIKGAYCPETKSDDPVNMHKTVLMPITGAYLSSKPGNKVPVLYLQMRTHDGPSAPLGYKALPILTRDRDSLFSRLCASAGIICDGMSQRKAAYAIAGAIALTGAIRCRRVGSKQDWQDIKLVDYPSKLEPWHLPVGESIKWEPMWDAPAQQESAAPDLSDL